MNTEARELEDVSLRAAAELARDVQLELFRAGDLECMILPHRTETYQKFRDWNLERQTRAHRDWCAGIGARFDKMWVDLAARRTAKTGSWIVVAVEECIRFYVKHKRGAHGLIAIPVQKKIGGVLVPLIKKIFRNAPPGYVPEFRASGQGEHEHLYIPACDGRIKLVGLDHHADALRGPFLDFGFVTEAGFTEIDLESVIVSEIMLQLQNLPHAFFVLESSAPKAVDHSFNRIFVLDAQARGAYSTQTILDNTSLSPEEIEDEIRMTGGRDSAICKRELFNIVEADPELMVVPEFDEKVHVVDPDEYPMPAHALAHEGYDPGTTDPHGLVGAWFDWMRQTIVICFSWAKSNASTGEVVSVARSYERMFWGSEHETPESRKPGAKLLRLANAKKTGGDKVWVPPEGSLSYWDENSWTLRPNPFSRISDVDNQFVIDMNVDYAMQVRDADKGPGSAEADEQHLRMLFSARHKDGSPKIVILRNGHTDDLIMQLRSGMWKVDDNHHKTDWQRTKILGHLDCLVGSTLVKAEQGDVPISEITVGMRVWTRRGLRAVTAAWCAGVRETWELTTTAGTLVGTADHRVWTRRGWKPLSELGVEERLCGWASSDEESRSSSTGTATGATPTLSSAITASTSPGARGSAITTCIRQCGELLMAPFRKAWWSITSMVTRSTTSWRTSSWSLMPSMASGTQGPSRMGPSARTFTRSHVSSAAPAFSHRSQGPSTAAPSAMPKTDDALASTISKLFASNAASSSHATSTRPARTAPVAVVASRSTGRTEAVYDISVEGEHEFFANGVLVHNCIAALKYMARDIRWRRNPFPPALRDLDAPNIHIPTRIADKMRNKGVLIGLPRMMGSRSPWRPR